MRSACESAERTEEGDNEKKGCGRNKHEVETDLHQCARDDIRQRRKAEAAEQDYAEDASTQFWVGFCLQPTRNQNLQVATDCTHRGGQPKVVPKRGLTYHRDGIIVAPPP